jgi:hypothetical protein
VCSQVFIESCEQLQGIFIADSEAWTNDAACARREEGAGQVEGVVAGSRVGATTRCEDDERARGEAHLADVVSAEACGPRLRFRKHEFRTPALARQRVARKVNDLWLAAQALKHRLSLRGLSLKAASARPK